MPSGARKRKASKKKGKNGEAQNNNNSSTSTSSNSSSTHSQGLDDRESDSGEIEREEEVEIVDYGKGLSDEIAEITKEVKNEKIDSLGVEFGAVDVPKENPVSVPRNGGLQDKQVVVDYGKELSYEIAEITKEAKSEKIESLGVEFDVVVVPKETPISVPGNGGLQDKQVVGDYGKGLSYKIAEITKEAKSEKIESLGVEFDVVVVPKETPISVPGNGGLQDKQVAGDYGKGLSYKIAEITKEAKSEKIESLGVEFADVVVPKETPISVPINGGLQDIQVAVDYGKGLSDEIIAEISKEAESAKIDTFGVDFGGVAVPKEIPISSPSNVVYSPQEANVGLGSSVASDLVESNLIKKADLPLQNSDVDEKLSSSLKGPRSEKTEGEIVSKDEIQTRSIDETLIGSNPLPVQRTSWIGCCGLFELFSGGNR